MTGTPKATTDSDKFWYTRSQIIPYKESRERGMTM